MHPTRTHATKCQRTVTKPPDSESSKYPGALDGEPLEAAAVSRATLQSPISETDLGR